jgi:hypothetical protein
VTDFAAPEHSDVAGGMLHIGGSDAADHRSSGILSFTDGSTEAAAAFVIYQSTIQSLLRQIPWDFARKIVRV